MNSPIRWPVTPARSTTWPLGRHSVIVHPKGPWQGFEVEVKGKLAALVGGESFRRPAIIVGHTWKRRSATYVPSDRFLPSLWCLLSKLSDLPHPCPVRSWTENFWQFQ
jgi:hypothetical protein